LKHFPILAALLAFDDLQLCGGGDATEQEKAEADAAVAQANMTIGTPNCGLPGACK